MPQSCTCTARHVCSQQASHMLRSSPQQRVQAPRRAARAAPRPTLQPQVRPQPRPPRALPPPPLLSPAGAHVSPSLMYISPLVHEVACAQVHASLCDHCLARYSRHANKPKLSQLHGSLCLLDQDPASEVIRTLGHAERHRPSSSMAQAVLGLQMMYGASCACARDGQQPEAGRLVSHASHTSTRPHPPPAPPGSSRLTLLPGTTMAASAEHPPRHQPSPTLTLNPTP